VVSAQHSLCVSPISSVIY